MSGLEEYVSADPVVVLNELSVEYKVYAAKERSRTASVLARAGQTLRRSGIETVNALNPLSLVVSHGESVGVIGRNGSGKSTMMSAISGGLKPTRGEVLASSTPVMLGVKAALMPNLSGEQNVYLGCLAMGMQTNEIDAAYPEILRVSGLGDAMRRPMSSYSAGMSSRLRFAIACSRSPEILIIDEALNTGDAQFEKRTADKLTELRAAAGCVFLVSHGLPVVRLMCNRAIWLDQGDLVMDGDPNEVTKEYYRYVSALADDKVSFAEGLRKELIEALPQTEIRYETHRPRHRL